MLAEQPKNPLHGITLETVLTSLVAHYGWAGLCQHINLQCFFNKPSIKSSLNFLRKTPWARQKVEELFLNLPKP
ncbi:MAG: VF530 family protein [Phaeospirillum sp.]|nr:VF530 family protein [Phaeospirillum sp.]